MAGGEDVHQDQEEVGEEAEPGDDVTDEAGIVVEKPAECQRYRRRPLSRNLASNQTR